jgi:hypothetical protein
MVVAVLLALTGLLWIAQGTGVFPVGGMANRMEWTYIGLGLEVVAAGLVFLALRRRR